MEYFYKYNIEGKKGDYVVSFPAIPEALTGGETKDEAHALARDCLIEAIAGYMHAGELIPDGAGGMGKFTLYLRPLEAAKVALHNQMIEGGMTQAGLANKLGVDLTIVRRWLNLNHNSKIEDINNALRLVFNKHLVTSLMDAAEIRAAKDESTLPHHIVKKLVIDEENPVKVLREYRGMTQGELAKAAGYSLNNYISMLENGQRELNDKAIKNIAAALNIDPDYLTQ
tara:strand:+ start:833 stop:1513 length:681 start_codon:yes stop_codon:yes gene_type:complete